MALADAEVIALVAEGGALAWERGEDTNQILIQVQLIYIYQIFGYLHLSDMQFRIMYASLSVRCLRFLILHASISFCDTFACCHSSRYICFCKFQLGVAFW
jgi:hypothetical protein